MPGQISRVQRFISETPWAITPSALERVLEVVERRVERGPLSAEEIAARVQAARPARPLARGSGAIAVLPIHGVIVHRANVLHNISGGASAELVSHYVRQVVADPNVSAVVLDIDSPGGSVFGIQELADVVHAARRRKPIVAVANSLAASAAYWIASQASEIVVAPGGQVGSVGVVAMHDDLSRRWAREGVKRTFITAGRFKAEGNEFEPLSDDARRAMQASVNAYEDMFVRTVARGRGTTPSEVRERYGQGRLLLGWSAISRKMADREDTLQATLDRLADGARFKGRSPLAIVSRTSSQQSADLERLRRRARVAIASCPDW